MRQSNDDRKARKNFMSSQLREMKELLRMTKRSKPESSSSSSSFSSSTEAKAAAVVADGSVEGAANSSSVYNNSAAAIFASMLLKGRAGLAQRWTALCDEEKQLSSALAGCRVKVRCRILNSLALGGTTF
jgi:hypothetical protein